MSHIQKIKSLSSTFCDSKAETTWRGTKKSGTFADSTTLVPNTFTSKKFVSTYQSDTGYTPKSNSEKSRLFDRISLKERQIEEANRQHGLDQKVFYTIQFQNGGYEKKGKGEFNVVYEPKQEPPFQPTLRKIAMPFSKKQDEPVKNCRKSAPLNVCRPPINPILQGENARLIKQKPREFSASLQSQVQNFKKFLLPSEWKEYNVAVIDPQTREKRVPFTDMKSVLQYEYASPKAR